MPAPVVVAEIVRSGFVEGHHYGSVVALAADGRRLVGRRRDQRDAAALVQQAAPGGRHAPGGPRPDGELLALASASHSGEAFHLEGVRRILRWAVSTSRRCRRRRTTRSTTRARRPVRAGGERSSIAMNCSGKHAAMLATCVVNGWDTATYLAPDHPLQQAIAATFADLTGEPVEVVAVDGCGAPLLSTSLTGLARAFRALAVATEGPEHRVAEAIRTHPEFVSGTRRDEAAAAARDPRRDRQGRRRVLLRRRPARRPLGRAQDRRRRRAGPPGPDGRRRCARSGVRRRTSRGRRWTPRRFVPRGCTRCSGGGEPVGVVRAVLP